MKKALILAFVTSLVFSVVPANAGGGDVEVHPNPVEHGETLKIDCFDCYNGETWDAEIKIKIKNKDKDVVYEDSQDVEDPDPEDPDPYTRVKVKIRKDDFPAGVYEVTIKCRHHFDDGDTGTWYKVTRTFRVKKND